MAFAAERAQPTPTGAAGLISLQQRTPALTATTAPMSALASLVPAPLTPSLVIGLCCPSAALGIPIAEQQSLPRGRRDRGRASLATSPGASHRIDKCHAHSGDMRQAYLPTYRRHPCPRNRPGFHSHQRALVKGRAPGRCRTGAFAEPALTEGRSASGRRRKSARSSSSP